MAEQQPDSCPARSVLNVCVGVPMIELARLIVAKARESRIEWRNDEVAETGKRKVSVGFDNGGITPLHHSSSLGSTLTPVVVL